ncbi:MAG: DUF5615 family PIN-like protein [Gloeomargaritaceae cyanobacterium C42_A2020_066]|nr:DUF5615 family PIN-like protein [Gloeomargaritaceae cyanobacterium C42_A2020_066]
MLAFLSDENCNGDCVRGLLRQDPNLNLLRVQDVNLRGIENPELLAWAAIHKRIALTHDRTTMPSFAYDRLIAGEPLAGLFVISDRMPLSQMIGELLLLNTCSTQMEWQGLVLYLPL